MSRRTEIEVGLTVLVAVGVLLWGVTWLKELQFQRSVDRGREWRRLRADGRENARVGER